MPWERVAMLLITNVQIKIDQRFPKGCYILYKLSNFEDDRRGGIRTWTPRSLKQILVPAG